MQFEQVAPGRPPPAARAVGRHRHGPRAAVRGAAGRALELRHRPVAAADRPRPRSCRGKTFDPTDYAGHDVSLRVIADHARAAAFLIADGVLPRQDRARVRAAPDHAAGASATASCSASKSRSCTRSRGDVDRRDGRRLPRAARARGADREDRARGGDALPRDARARHAHPRRARSAQAPARRRVPGELAFSSTTPTASRCDLTRVIAERARLRRSTRPASSARWTSSARAASSRARARSRSRAMFQAIAERVGATKFLGYEATDGDVEDRRAGRRRQARSTSVGPCSKDVARRRPTRRRSTASGRPDRRHRRRWRRPQGDASTVHDCKPAGVDAVRAPRRGRQTGELRVGDTVELDGRRRAPRRHPRATTRRRTSCTGRCATCSASTSTQKGSLVAPDRLRFDFSHFAPLTDEREAAGRGPGQRARSARTPPPTPRCCRSTRPSRRGAIAIFGEKYGDTRARRDDGRVDRVLRRHARARAPATSASSRSPRRPASRRACAASRRSPARARSTTCAGSRTSCGETGERLQGAAPFEVAARVDKLQAELREQRARRSTSSSSKLASGGGGRDLVVRGARRQRRRVLADAASTSTTPRRCARSATSCATSSARASIVLAGVEGDKITLVAMVTQGSRRQGSTPARSSARSRRRSAARAAGAPDMAQGGGSQPAAPRRRAGARVRPRSWLTERTSFDDRRGEDVGGDAGRGAAPAACRTRAGRTSAACARRARLRRRRRASWTRRAACAPGSAIAMNLTAPRPDQTPAGLPHRVRGRPHRHHRQAVRHLQRPVRAQGDRHGDGPDARASGGARGKRATAHAALHRAPHRQGHVGPALLRQDARWPSAGCTRVFQRHTAARAYLAVAEGAVDAMRIESRHRRRPGRRHPRLDPPRRTQGQHAVTHVEPLRRLRGATLCRVRLETGRTHQIRIHLSERGHPLVGETVYIRDLLRAGRTPLPAPRLMLHAALLGFRHPVTAWPGLAAPPPPDFVAVFESLGGSRGDLQ